jgi:hypothetical protein
MLCLTMKFKVFFFFFFFLERAQEIQRKGNVQAQKGMMHL